MRKKDNDYVVIPSELELQLLTILLKAIELYGLEALEQINFARNKLRMKPLTIGSLYPTLKRMETSGLVEGEFREGTAGEGSARKKYYRITTEGKIAIKRADAYQRILKGENNVDIPEGKPTFVFLSSIFNTLKYQIRYV